MLKLCTVGLCIGCAFVARVRIPRMWQEVAPTMPGWKLEMLGGWTAVIVCVVGIVFCGVGLGWQWFRYERPLNKARKTT